MCSLLCEVYVQVAELKLTQMMTYGIVPLQLEASSKTPRGTYNIILIPHQITLIVGKFSVIMKKKKKNRTLYAAVAES